MVRQSLAWVRLTFISISNQQTSPLNAAELRACWQQETKFSLLSELLGGNWFVVATVVVFGLVLVLSFGLSSPRVSPCRLQQPTGCFVRPDS